MKKGKTEDYGHDRLRERGEWKQEKDKGKQSLMRKQKRKHSMKARRLREKKGGKCKKGGR